MTHTHWEAVEQYGAHDGGPLQFCYTDIFKEGESIASVWMKPTKETSIANAEYIVRCCNSHADLVAALKEAMQHDWRYGDGLTEEVIEQCNNALAKAQGE